MVYKNIINVIMVITMETEVQINSQYSELCVDFFFND